MNRYRLTLRTLACVSLLAALALSAHAQVTIQHTPLRMFHNDTQNGYQIRARLTSTAGTITAGRVWYAVDSTSYQLLFMQPTGRPDEFIATIPGQPVGSTVRYWILAGDDQGNVQHDPVGAPGQGELAHVFLVGHYEIFFQDDFDGLDLGWISGFVATEDDWEWGAPAGTGQDDPPLAHSGTQCRGNDLFSTNGKYSANVHNFLDSPPIDCTGRDTVHLMFRRWLTVERFVFDQARIYVDGNLAWESRGINHILDAEWKFVNIDISQWAANNPAAVIRFELVSDGGLEFGGWTIDDFWLVERILEQVQLDVSSNTPSLGDLFTVTITADPNTNWFFFGAKRPGNGTFQVPGGPVVFTGLEGSSTRMFRQGVTDGAGMGGFSRTVPNRPRLIGVVRWASTVGFANGWTESNLHKITIMP